MNAIMFLIGIISMGLMIFLGLRLADWHYKTYKGDYPLYIWYPMIFMILYAAIIIALEKDLDLI